jgi:hypothetical protein
MAPRRAPESTEPAAAPAVGEADDGATVAVDLMVFPDQGEIPGPDGQATGDRTAMVLIPGRPAESVARNRRFDGSLADGDGLEPTAMLAIENRAPLAPLPLSDLVVPPRPDAVHQPRMSARTAIAAAFSWAMRLGRRDAPADNIAEHPPVTLEVATFPLTTPITESGLHAWLLDNGSIAVGNNFSSGGSVHLNSLLVIAPNKPGRIATPQHPFAFFHKGGNKLQVIPLAPEHL